MRCLAEIDVVRQCIDGIPCVVDRGALRAGNGDEGQAVGFSHADILHDATPRC